jgi:hypothetical protein
MTWDGNGRFDEFYYHAPNTAPIIDSLVVTPGEPVAVNTPVTLSCTIIDPDTSDTITTTIDWGDSHISEVTGNEVDVDHPYTVPGVYTILVSVSDGNGGIDSETYQYVVVYDPVGGFVTGGGWIDSPEGAYEPDPTLAGKANFGFVAKYKKGQITPIGNTEFQFKAGDMNFHSDSYEWLIITGAKAQFKGEGKINGEGDYKFKIWTTDGELSGGQDVDAFRIKIWEEDELGLETVVYDNKEETELGGGSIKIHKS